MQFVHGMFEVLRNLAEGGPYSQAILAATSRIYNSPGLMSDGNLS